MTRKANLGLTIVAVLGLLTLSGLTLADELYVPSQYGTIQAAIDDANDGDVVVVADGVYTGTGNKNLDFKGKTIIVQSENGPEYCVIDCDGAETEFHRGFWFHSEEEEDSVLEGFTIINGWTESGGGIYCENGSPTIVNCNITDNYAKYYGGGISNENSSPTIINCNIRDNYAKYYGGGISNENSSAIISGCTFNENSTISRNGGGIYNRESDPTITDCIFTGNVAAWDGGGINNENSSNPIISNCEFVGNAAVDNDGGGINNRDSTPLISNCSFIGNSANDWGGGMRNVSSSSPTISDCIFIGNSSNSGAGVYNYASSNPTFMKCEFKGNIAQQNGGGIGNRRGCHSLLSNCIIAGNTATIYGGGMFNQSFGEWTGGVLVISDCEPVLTNCIISDNSAAGYGGGIWSDTGKQVSPTKVTASIPTLNNCIVWGNSDATGSGENTQLKGDGPVINYSCIQGWTGSLGGVGNIGVDPCFTDYSYWDANGLWVEGDYHLLEDSVCINTGDPNFVPEPNETDLDGRPRVLFGRIDMGAYEFNHIPIADAGPDQTVYAWIDGWAEVELDGSASFDPDGDELTYLWSWVIDGNNYDVNGVDPVIELPVGEYVINLTVNDGIGDSEPDQVVITVIEALESRVLIFPPVIVRHSRQKNILAWIRLPEGIDKEQISDEPILLYPGEIEAVNQYVIEHGRRGHKRTSVLAFFGKAELMDAVVDNGRVEVEAVGSLKSGRYFYGSDTVLIKARRWRPSRRWRFN